MSVLDLADEPFVSLTTYRRNGEGVPTPVWVARDGDSLVVTTTAESGKVKRLRANPSVVLRPCTRSGQVADHAPSVEGSAVVIDDAAQAAALVEPVRRKYGLQFKLVMGVEKVVGRGRRTRVALRITDPR